jgi:chemotaxis protein methyltransferase CheR
MSNLKKICVKNLATHVHKEFAIAITDKNKKYIEEYVRNNFENLYANGNSSDFKKIDLTSLINEMTINETYFFRDPAQIEFIKKDIVKRVNKKHKVVVWSLGCSSGEEPYTVAILCDELGISDKVKIYGFDINTEVLEKAKNGVYSDWSFRGVENHYINNYFKKLESNSFKLNEKITEKVDFYNFNIKKDLFNLDFLKNIEKPDIVLCRNILMYFEEKEFISISNQVAQLLNPHGYVITSAQETYILKKAELTQKFSDGTFIFYKKDDLNKNTKKTKNNDELLIKDEDGELNTEAIKEAFQNPENKQSLLKLLIKIIENKDYYDSIIFCDIAIKNEPHDFLNYLIKGKLLNTIGDIENSELNFKKALFLNMKCPISHYEYAKVLIKLNKDLKAKRHLDRAFKLLEKNSITNDYVFELLKIEKNTLITSITTLSKNLEFTHV